MSWLYTIVFVGMMISHNADPGSVRITLADLRPQSIAQPSQQDETERIEKSFPLTANGRVSVSNVNGSINMIAWDRNEVKLIAIKHADTKEHLADVDIKIDARPDYFSVESDYGDDRGWKTDSDRRWRNNDRVTVEYELTVPLGAMLNEIETVNGSVTVNDFSNMIKVSAVNGAVRAGNLRGTADLSTVNGEVIADFDRLASGSKIALETVNGRVTLTIPSDSSADVKAESLNGSITNDFGLENRKGKYVGNSLHGRLGGGEVAIKLESVNGQLAVKRKNDGRPLSPTTNLLPPKGADEDGEFDQVDQSDVRKMNRDIDRNVRDSQRKAMQDVQKEVGKIKVEIPKIKAETIKSIEESVNSAEIEKNVRDSLLQQQAALERLRDANFLVGVPRVEIKSNSFTVKGTPKVTIDAKGCAVRVKGWDSSEVKYSISQVRGALSNDTPNVVETHTDSSVTLKVTDGATPGGAPAIFNKSSSIRLEVFVPRKTNLKIISDEEIRLDGVSGDLEITGGDEPINIRDSEGTLNITNDDGRVRVIGFDGDVTARTSDGDVYLEGKFGKVTGKGEDGSFTVTLPADANVDINSNTKVQADGFNLTDRGSNRWRIGSGGSNYLFNVSDGSVTFRNLSLLSAN
jgi:DUF4097 and DUF4098 domain-containing protein YvlB